MRCNHKFYNSHLTILNIYQGYAPESLIQVSVNLFDDVKILNLNIISPLTILSIFLSYNLYFYFEITI